MPHDHRAEQDRQHGPAQHLFQIKIPRPRPFRPRCRGRPSVTSPTLQGFLSSLCSLRGWIARAGWTRRRTSGTSRPTTGTCCSTATLRIPTSSSRTPPPTLRAPSLADVSDFLCDLLNEDADEAARAPLAPLAEGARRASDPGRRVAAAPPPPHAASSSKPQLRPQGSRRGRGARRPRRSRRARRRCLRAVEDRPPARCVGRAARSQPSEVPAGRRRGGAGPRRRTPRGPPPGPAWGPARPRPSTRARNRVAAASVRRRQARCTDYLDRTS